MKAKILKVLTVISLIIVMTSANVILLGYNIAIAVSEQLEAQNIDTSNTNVQFDAYFKVNETKVHSKQAKIGENLKVYLNINVLNNGTLNNGKIKINDSNFKIKDNTINNTYIKSINKENNEIELNPIIYNNVEIEIPIEFNNITEVTEEYYSKETTLSLEGGYTQGKKEKQIQGNIITQIDWTDDSDITLTQGISKVVDLNTNGLLVEQAINTKVTNGILPRATEEVEVIIPKIANELPQTVKVLLNGTKIENGIDYDFKTGVIKIKGENYWNNNINRYRLIYVYNSTARDNLKSIDLDTNINTKLFTKDNIQKDNKQTVQLNYSGNIVSLEKSITKEIYKGYLYTGSDDNETYYQENNVIEISKAELINNISLNTTNSYFSDGTNTADAQNLTYYKQMIINKESFIRIFGNNGYIYIKDENGNVVNTIDNSTEADSNGNINIDYDGTRRKLSIETSRPIVEGEFSIKNIKYIKGNTGYTKEQLKQFTTLTTNEIVTTNLGEEEKTVTINLLDTKLEGRLEISNTNLSTLESNKNVQFLIVLKSNSEQHDLWKNPVVEITVPKEISVIGKTISLLNCQDSLKIDSTKREQLNNGDTKLRITLKGEQANYINNVNDGVQIVFYADLNIDNTIPTQTKQITTTYTNENREGEIGTVSKDVNLKSKDGVMIVNKVSDFNSNGDVIESTTNKIVTGELDKGTEEKIANINLYAINNYDDNISDSVIVGNIPAEGTWSDGEQSANISFQSILASEISVNKPGAKIYYSEDANATKDSNSWKEKLDDISKAKSFKIEFANGEMSAKEVVQVSYKIKIPDNIEGGDKTLNTTKLSYKYQGNDMNIVSTNVLEKPEKNYARVAMLSASNEAGVEVKMAVTSAGQTLENGADVYEGQAIQYSLKITNNTDKTIQNIKMVATHTNVVYYGYREEIVDDINFHYVEEQDDLTNKEIRIESISPGETKTLEYQISANKDVTDGTVTTGEILISGDNLNEIKISAYTNPIKQGKLKLRLLAELPIEEKVFTEDKYTVSTIIENISKEDLENVTFKMNLPENASFIDELGIAVDSDEAKIKNIDNKNLEILIPKIEKDGDNQTVKVFTTLKMEGLDINKLKEIIILNSNAQVDNETYYSNEVKQDVYQNNTKITVKQTGSIDKEVVEDGEELIYTTKIKNEGYIKKKIDITDILPAGTMIQSAKLYKDGEEINDIVGTSVQSVYFTYTIKPNEEIVLEITTNIVGLAVENNTLTNVVHVTGMDLAEKSNEITYKYYEKKDEIDGGVDIDPPVDPDKPDPDQPDPDNPDQVKVTSVTLNEKSINLDIRESKQLVATINPENATNKNVYWTSSNTDVAYVDSSGLVTGFDKGTAVIIVTTEDGNKVATCTVTVTDSSEPIDPDQPDKVNVTDISLNINAMKLNINSSKQLVATINPENATNKNVYWVSTNPSVATVDNEGNVTAVGEGTAIIVVTTEDGNRTAMCTVTVTDSDNSSEDKINVTGVSLNANSIKLNKNDRKQLIATVRPVNATNKSVYWTSSNESVATVDNNGNVTAIGKGTATITVITVDRNQMATCTVTVVDSNSTDPDTPNGDDTNNDNSDSDQTITKTISGLAWIDANGDGIRESEEKFITNMNVYLLDKEGNVIQNTTTDENGQYKFDKVKQGKYYVVFDYDTNTYQITQYQAEGINNTNNSDVVENTISLNGKKQKVAITKELEVKDNDLSNIDGGFTEMKKSDMRLDKYVTKITVQNAKGTKVQNYDNKQLAKVEIKSKYLNGSLVVVEYQIKVTNEGETEEYVSEIIDNMPNDFQFSTEINRDWYKKTDGSLATKELANEVINPGESKVVTLTLTKTMTPANVGVSTNIAEIGEQSNKLSIPDIDSTPNNNKQDEDDLSKAEVIISVATGLMPTYIILIIITICMFGVGVYFINKEVEKF